MTAEIVAVGTELLLGEIVDTNSAELGRALAKFGVACYRRQVVGDNAARIAEAVSLALSRAGIVFTIGGLGPTLDDVTREGIAAALDEPLTLDRDLSQEITKKLASRGVAVTESHSRQAMRLACSEPIANPNGTAPGMICSKGGKTVIAMPGPRLEFVPMLHGPVGEWLGSLGLAPLRTRTIKIVGLGESLVEKELFDLMEKDDPTVAPYAKTGEVHLRVASRTDVSSACDEIVRRLGRHIYGFDDDSLESVVLQTLRDRNETLAVAESCTGGGLGSLLTSVPGSSDVFLGGVIAYSNGLKVSLLGVQETTLASHGAVSEECAKEMAAGARAMTGATWGVSVTGVAGPGGGTADKPVGQVYIGVSGPIVERASQNRFAGTRQGIRERSVVAALTDLWRSLRGGQ